MPTDGRTVDRDHGERTVRRHLAEVDPAGAVGRIETVEILLRQQSAITDLP